MPPKILLTIAVLFCVVTASIAQINEGQYLSGGGFYFNNSKVSPDFGDESHSSGINAQLGKMVKLNTVVGIIVSYNNYNSHLTDIPDSNFNKSSGFSAGVFYRKYKRLLTGFYLFGELDGVYFHTNNSQGNFNSDNNNQVKNDGGTISFAPGLSYAIFHKMQIELLMTDILALSYTHSTYNGAQATPAVSAGGNGNAFSINASLNSNFLSNFGIGFKFLLGK